MPVEPQILKRREVARSRLFRIEEMLLRFSNGAERVYERLVQPVHNAVLIVALIDDDTFILVREYCGGTENYQLGLHKGACDAGEDRLTAANRELMEEAGYGAHHLEFVKSLSLAPGYMSHSLDIILARDLYEKRLPGDEPEPLDVVTWRFSDLDGLVGRQDFSEGRSIAALFIVRDLMRGIA
jgi:ADP-ribose diphosphatase